MASSLVSDHATASKNEHEPKFAFSVFHTHAHSGYGNWHHTQPGLSEVATDGNNGNGNVNVNFVEVTRSGSGSPVHYK